MTSGVLAQGRGCFARRKVVNSSGLEVGCDSTATLTTLKSFISV